jgi:hypothetical protein
MAARAPAGLADHIRAARRIPGAVMLILPDGQYSLIAGAYSRTGPEADAARAITCRAALPVIDWRTANPWSQHLLDHGPWPEICRDPEVWGPGPADFIPLAHAARIHRDAGATVHHAPEPDNRTIATDLAAMAIALRDLLVWARVMGGWDAPCWEHSRATLDRAIANGNAPKHAAPGAG